MKAAHLNRQPEPVKLPSDDTLPRRGHLADVITDLRMAAGTQPILAGQPAVLMTVRGGNYRPGTPR